jgi:LysW-gamma-L-alpha-aminoadipyl-6-phosphate/LysW-L-glutamyl-5-phosphate reductase
VSGVVDQPAASADFIPPAVVRAGVVGASGILGGELLRLLAGHPRLELEYVAAQAKAGRSATELNPHLKDAGIGEFEAFDARVAAKRCDVVFVATPPEIAGRAVPELLDAGADVVIDLSPAYRIGDPELHRQWYPDVDRDQQVVERAVYALPELNREAIAGGAPVLAMPGCFATAILLAALPLRELDGVRFDAIAVDGKSGSTGSGAKLRESGAHVWRSNVVAPYAPRGHRHVAEVREAMGRSGVRSDGAVPKIGMTTYGVDLVRGLSVGLYSFFEGDLDERALRRCYHRTYRDEPFVRVQVGRGSALPLPDPKAVIGSNFCDVAAFVDESSARFVLIGAIDNLVKGGSGQAVQACNVRLGFPEQLGLEALPVFPV